MREVARKKKRLLDRLSERFDDFIGVFSPKTAYRRKAFRFASQYAFSSYRGAEKNRLRSSWIPGGGSADEDLLAELPDLRERSRDLNRNDAHASGITTTMVTNVVGTGIKPQSRIDYESLEVSEESARIFQKRAERTWQRWTPFADSTERMDFYEIQQLVDRQILENGEVILLPLMLDDKSRPYKLAFEVIEADRLQTPMDKKGNRGIRHGVELGDRGQPVAYYIRKTHPGDTTLRLSTPKSNEFMRIPSKNTLGRPNVLHLYWVVRPGQTRGVPFFSPIMTLFKDLADYLEAEVVAARVAACFAVFVERSDAYTAAVTRADKSNASGQRIEELEPGMIEYMAPGEKISGFNPQRPGGTFEPFVERILRAISAALGMPYELVAKDFSKTNYSSARAALLEARRYFKLRQEWLSRRLCQPAWEMLIEEAYLKGELKIPNFYNNRLDWTRAHWIAPGWGWVDPTKEVKASRESVEGYISTLADEAAAVGRDWEEIMYQRKREEEKRIELGLPASKTKESKEPKDEEDEEGKKEDKESSQESIQDILKEVSIKFERLKKTGREGEVILNGRIRDAIRQEVKVS